MLLLALPAAAATGLYQASVIVTGTAAPARAAAFARTLAQVLAKASGNRAWLTDSRVGTIDPKPLIQAFAYVDRESGLPKHDEQGTRDRPYDLIVRFDPAAIDALLRRWDDAPWPAPRPLLVIDLVITPRGAGPIAMRADTDPDEPHRGALLDAADAAGFTLAIPAANDPLPPPAGSPVLHGTMVWSDAEFGWVSQWSVSPDSQDRRWGLHGTGFDAAYRDGIAGAALVLSGH